VQYYSARDSSYCISSSSSTPTGTHTGVLLPTASRPMDTANRFRRDCQAGSVANADCRGGQLRCEDSRAHLHAIATSTPAPSRGHRPHVPQAWTPRTTTILHRPRQECSLTAPENRKPSLTPANPGAANPGSTA